jgi:DNA-binding MarR family transcriptional regulator
VGKNSGAPTHRSDAEARITLELLQAVEENSRVSQRSLAGELDIALGLTNSYLKRCIRKGLVKVSHVPANRYAYYLTPKGFTEKSRLTANYLKRSFNFYREARAQCDGALTTCSSAGWQRLALLGAGELAEITILCALQSKVQIVGIVETDGEGQSLLNVPLVSEISALRPHDALLLTDLSRPQQTYKKIANELPPERILIPSLLGVKRAAT